MNIFAIEGNVETGEIGSSQLILEETCVLLK